MILAIGQENAFPWIERDLGIEFDKWDVPKVDLKTFQSTRDGVFFGGDAAFGPKNIIWAVEHGHQAAISIHNHCQSKPVTERLRAGREPAVHEDGHARVGLRQRLQPGRAAPDAARVAQGTLQEAQHRSGARLHRRADRERGAALPQLRRADGVRDQAVHRVRRLHRHLPGRLPDHHAQRRGSRPAHAAQGAREERHSGFVRIVRAETYRRASWSKTKTCVCTAACARNAAPPRPGTCRSRPSSGRMPRTKPLPRTPSFPKSA